jgi:trk system potassium uptake protein
LHPRVIAGVLGAVIAVGGAAMLVPTAFSLLAADGNALAFGLPVIGSLALGMTFFLGRRQQPYVSAQDVFLSVVLGWVGVAVAGSAPFVLSGLMEPVDAFFNSMAGFTTTGASTVSPEEFSSSLLLWRSMNQWLGG